jgi:fatty-acyl-CoA synthase
LYGVPDAKYGEEIMAWVKLRPGASASEDEIREFCRGQIAHYKIPRYVKFTDGFPMTVTGKIQKFLMRQQSIEELHLEGAAAIKMA